MLFLGGLAMRFSAVSDKWRFESALFVQAFIHSRLDYNVLPIGAANIQIERWLLLLVELYTARQRRH